MSHSPLKMFRDYQNKHVLVIGQGPVDTIARSLGFSKVNLEPWYYNQELGSTN